MISADETGDDQPDSEEENGSVLTPLVDVVFMLVAFLLLTANAAPFTLEVDLPSANSATAADPDPHRIELGVTQAGWVLDGQVLANADSVRAALNGRFDGADAPPLILLVNRDLPAQTLITTFDLAREAGAGHVDLAIHPDSATP
ncbi:ExbD/TolR family protein [Maricaulis parjimensis]|uniref:ExbD/TolR family protein n=1 Tax=Maricaulis parjimensis TaxID=144023 RepID=UPI001939CDC3|nr:biopolymer transporter ExbD [Maricaulis parjimensis]